MDINSVSKKLSTDDKQEINKQVQADLIEHLYRGCLPGTISGLIISVVFLIVYYGYTSTPLLLTWLILFDFMMIALSCLFFFYSNYKNLLSLDQWEWLYSALMIGCAISWVPGIYLIPQDMTRQYISLIAFFMATMGYATGTIGQFRLCVTTLCIILIPLIIWSLLHGGIFYNVIAGFTVIYMFFMFGTNLRSTRYFKESLKLKLENTLVSYQANHDLLTNLPNQRLLPQFAEKGMEALQNTNQTLALVCFSLNRMEIIEDTLGHQASNRLVKSVSDRLKLFVTNMAKTKENTSYILTISRKDTFNILLVPLSLDEIETKIKLLFSVLDEPFYLEQKGIRLTASLGVSIYKKDGETIDELLRNAEAATLQAKQYGGNKFEFYRAEINAEKPRQIEMENDLHDVIKKNQLQVYYQPLINIKTGQLSGMEALLRWKHPVQGFISPAQFIPLAEETGLIIPIGEWVMEEACRQTLIWHRMGFASLKVAVNLSQKQMRDEHLLEKVQNILKKTGFNPQYLELEITETSILDESAIPMIKKLKEMGLSLAVDDFGTGYSGLSYLKRFSIDKLKIDQSFVRDIPANIESMTIVSAIIAMAKELKVQVLAEGVETKEQLQFLKSKGCEYVQGYYFSKPLEANFFTQLLLNQRTLANQTT